MMWSKVKKYFSSPVSIFLSIAFWGTSVCAAEQYHLVIDISGNMQKVDAKKERIAVLESFIQSLPNGSQAGIWTYARQVNKLVPAETVNSQWKAKASQALKNLAGYGPYANLPLALDQATYEWRNSGNKPGRNLILLTDNGVKGGDNAQQNKAATEELSKNLIPQLQNSGVKVYAVAFKDADTALLQQMARETKGDFQQLASASDLPAAFAKLESQFGMATTAESKEASSEITATSPNNPVAAATTAEPSATPSLESATGETTPNNTAELTSAENVPPNAAISNESVSGTSVNTNDTSSEIPALGEAESDEIRAALAKAETELQDLLHEYATVNQNPSATATTLSAQQAAEPLVITLNDGSVLVTPDKSKAQSVSDPNASVNNAINNTMPTSGTSPSEGTVSAGQSTNAGYIEEEPAATAPEEWTAASTNNTIWPMVLTILAIINISIIILLFVGRYFWLRHKNKLSSTELGPVDP